MPNQRRWGIAFRITRQVIPSSATMKIPHPQILFFFSVSAASIISSSTLTSSSFCLLRSAAWSICYSCACLFFSSSFSLFLIIFSSSLRLSLSAFSFAYCFLCSLQNVKSLPYLFLRAVSRPSCSPERRRSASIVWRSLMAAMCRAEFPSSSWWFKQNWIQMGVKTPFFNFYSTTSTKSAFFSLVASKRPVLPSSSTSFRFMPGQLISSLNVSNWSDTMAKFVRLPQRSTGSLTSK